MEYSNKSFDTANNIMAVVNSAGKVITVELPSLVNRLGALKHELGDFDENWLALYEEQRFALEEVNSIAMDEGNTQPLIEHSKITLRVISNIKSLINEVLE